MAFPSHGPTVDIDDQAACGCSISQATEPLSKLNLEQTRYALAHDIPEEFHHPRVTQGHLCSICIEMLSVFALTGEGDGKAFGQHHQTKDNLQAAVDESCYICRTLDRQLKEFARVQWCVTPQDPMTAEHVSSYDVDFRTYEPDGAVRQQISFVVRRLIEDTPMMRTAALSRTWASTGSEHAIDLVKMWLQLSIDGPKTKERDLMGQDLVGSSVHDHWFPTPILDVSGDKMRLIESYYANRQRLYATLSYCWGTTPFLRLTPETNAQLRAGVDIETLPILFQQTIMIVQSLGIHYLWIDCFCIIQGQSPEAIHDWQIEAARMAQVYSHGFFNIAADESTTPFEPLLRHRQQSDVDPCHFSWEPWVCPRGMYRIEEQYETAMTLVRAHLHTRGWTHQERLLCTKMLHFGAHQVAWECGNGIWNETYPDGLLLRQAGRRFNIPHAIGSDELYAEWKGVISTYSERALTYPEKDKLIAVAAMARRYTEACEDEYKRQGYVAGHMRSSLLFSMCWQTGEEAKRAHPWRAPSWSWASIDGPLAWEVESIGWHWVKSLAEVVEVHLEHSIPGDIYGPLKAGSLRLKARLLGHPGASPCGKIESIDLEDWLVHGLSFQLSVSVDDAPDFPLDPSTVKVLPLAFCSKKSNRIRPAGDRNIYGILVAPRASTERCDDSGQYRRLGFARLTCQAKGEKSMRSAEVEDRVLNAIQTLPEHDLVIV
ncbi:hypothetical protein M409DRAFT_52828 [Zasmidium cellare ATCC 36951]|uniref:Heterokaryon incompatibility domain-containing protein n=1 Tax=Zasmidium cellare ATCC 36951 TaxID=1080233 RepID=A0A6A6CQ64_ZASCE|nr:uncharacterized protein M409DRAFT_52828 [Zasmidium cellare ATCC 36951]KAF2168823.1 hypothetical protein M409DRAFT_52828 [Zasmidium cellare ATCC 36951]